MISPLRFSPSTAVVTGSDSGIGRAVAVRLAESGLDVGITWHEDEEGAERTTRARERPPLSWTWT
ncbi:short-chain dehydrogenase/reductase SDR [Actinobacteria bacterium OV450]|nr:short-chain dehydrogenase/reductase SDR [Actinobacteria bacterium OV450]